MAGNKPLSLPEFKNYAQERNRQQKSYATEKRTWKVMYKSLCSACEYNASNGKKIIYNCPNCKVRYWNNCSITQVKSGVIRQKLEALYGNIEWIKAFDHTGSQVFSWKRHNNNYTQDLYGRWTPNE